MAGVMAELNQIDHDFKDELLIRYKDVFMDFLANEHFTQTYNLVTAEFLSYLTKKKVKWDITGAEKYMLKKNVNDTERL
jgi:hypothetical protein